MRIATQLNITEQNDIIRSIRAVAGNDGALVAMVHTKAKQHAIHEDTVRLVVMSAALLVQGEQLEMDNGD